MLKVLWSYHKNKNENIGEGDFDTASKEMDLVHDIQNRTEEFGGEDDDIDYMKLDNEL